MGLTLKQARLVREKTQRDMAEMLGVYVDTYRKLENDPGLVTINQAKKIADYLKMNIDDIFLPENSTLSL